MRAYGLKEAVKGTDTAHPPAVSVYLRTDQIRALKQAVEATMQHT
jgi:hypothetical protein